VAPLPLFFLAGRLAHFDGGIIDCFLGSANLSLFAYLSQICGICARSKMLMFKMLMFKRGSNSRRRGRVADPESRHCDVIAAVSQIVNSVRYSAIRIVLTG
jgi:hypothetical protein